MLSSLHIENIAIIKKVDVDFSVGFNVLTGETGAGKSILIDSINLLRGARFDRSIIRSGEEKATVSALFCNLSTAVQARLVELGFETDENNELLIQRTISSDGKSAAKINGRSISNTLLKEIALNLFTIHGQNDNLVLSDEMSSIKLLDKYAGIEESVLEYQELYRKYCDVKKQLEELSADESERIREIEMLRYQISDIESAELVVGEEEALSDKKVKVKNFERISKQLNFAYRALHGSEKANACYIVERTIAALESISDVVPETEKICNSLNEVYSALEDASELIYDLRGEDFENPDKVIDEIESRLDVIYKLKRKYGSDVESILNFLEKAKNRLDELENADSSIAQFTKQEKELFIQLKAFADELHAERRAASFELAGKISKNLEFLDMPKVKFSVVAELNKKDGVYKFDKYGADNVSFLASTNVGEPELPISKIASGGELARIMLSVKNATAEKDLIETLIFDEIDTGVSGKTARKIGINLLLAGQTAQVICITHSAQIASLADRHLFISKSEVDNRICTRVTALDENSQIAELARILGGIEITDLQRATARELVAEKTHYLEA